MDESERSRGSRMLSMWLRHKPERGGLTLSKEGWAAIPAILEAFARQEMPLNRADFDNIIRLDLKGRFEVEGERVRARYGHSVELEEQPHPGQPPATLFHGTPQRYLPKILEMGLKPMKRRFVHLSPDRPTAREIGRRRDQDPAILRIDAHRAWDDGILFYPRGRGIWLSDPIPPDYLILEEAADDMPNTEASPARAPSPRPGAPGEPRRRRPKGGFMKKRG